MCGREEVLGVVWCASLEECGYYCGISVSGKDGQGS